MHALPILLLTLTTTTLVLRSGDRFVADGPVKTENGVVTFRVKGTLYSLPASEVERVGDPVPETRTAATTPAPARLRVSDEDRKRLLAELEANHSGTAAPPHQRVEPLPPAPKAAQQAGLEENEWEWRRQAKGYEESIRRAKEDLELLETRARELQMKIFQLVALGYKPHSYTYDSTMLANTLDQIPRAQLEVARAERAFVEFKEEARRRGVMPGWLR